MSTIKALDTILAKKPKILVIGDVAIDYRYDGCEVRGVADDVPLPRIVVTQETGRKKFLAAAGASARNLRRFGCEVTLLTAAGTESDDYNIPIVAAQARERGIVFKYVQEGGRALLQNDTLIGRGVPLVRVLWDDSRPIMKETERHLLRAFEEQLVQHDAVLLCDYQFGTVTKELAESVIAMCNRHRKPILVDTRQTLPEIGMFHGATGLKLTHVGINKIIGSRGDEKSQKKAMTKIMGAGRHDFVVVTLGRDGVALLEKGGKSKKNIFKHFKPFKTLDIYDTSGVRGAVSAPIVAGMASAISLSEGVALGNIVGNILVGKHGPEAIFPSEVRRVLHSQKYLREGNDDASNIHSLSSLEELIRDLRSRKPDIKIGVTSGVFDLTHQGHRRFLNQAGEQCDFLVVIVASDRTTKEFKGEERPVLPEDSRALVVTSLAGNDAAVIISDTLYHEQILCAIRPHILFKGDDYANRTIIGAELVNEVVLLRREPEPLSSTTAIIQEVVKKHEGKPAKIGRDMAGRKAIKPPSLDPQGPEI